MYGTPLQVLNVQRALNLARVVQASGALDGETGDLLGRLSVNFGLFAQAIRAAGLDTQKPPNHYICTVSGFLRMLRDGGAHARSWVGKLDQLYRLAAPPQVVPPKLQALINLWRKGDGQSVAVLAEHLTM